MLEYPDNPNIRAISLTAAYDFTYVNTPAISHDGTRIAFAGTRGEVTDIYVIDLDGDNLREVTSGEVGSFNFRPVWDPFDNIIAYASNRDGDNRWNIIIHTLATGEMLAFNSEQYNTGLINDGVYNIRFFDWLMTGDPGFFVVTTDLIDPQPGDCWPDCQVGLYFYDMGTDDMNQIAVGMNEVGGPSISPDGKQIAFHGRIDGQWQIFIYTVESDTTTRFSDMPGTNNFFSPKWSPDGQRLIFTTLPETGSNNYDIAISPADHFDPTWLTESGAADYEADW